MAKFAAGVVETGGKIPLTLMVHLDLQISPQIFEKILCDPWGLGEDDS